MTSTEHNWMKQFEGLKISDLPGWALVEMFEYAVQREHYDPIESKPSLFEVADLKIEVFRRLGLDKYGN